MRAGHPPQDDLPASRVARGIGPGQSIAAQTTSGKTSCAEPGRRDKPSRPGTGPGWIARPLPSSRAPQTKHSANSGGPEGADALRRGGRRRRVAAARGARPRVAPDAPRRRAGRRPRAPGARRRADRERALERRRETERDLGRGADARAEEPARVPAVRRVQRPAVAPVDRHRLDAGHHIARVTFVTVRRKLRRAVTAPVWRMPT